MQNKQTGEKLHIQGFTQIETLVGKLKHNYCHLKVEVGTQFSIVRSSILVQYGVQSETEYTIELVGG